MTNQPISPFGRLRRPAGLIRWNRSYTTEWDPTTLSRFRSQVHVAHCFATFRSGRTKLVK
jgi:hypothetical protein